MWNLPPRIIPRLGPSAWSLKEELRRRAYRLQEIGGNLDAVLLRVVSIDHVAAAVLRELLNTLALQTDHFDPDLLWVKVSAVEISRSLHLEQRWTQKLLAKIANQFFLVERRRKPLRGGGSAVLYRVNDIRLNARLEEAEWWYLSECFPEEERPVLVPAQLRALEEEIALRNRTLCPLSDPACRPSRPFSKKKPKNSQNVTT